MSLHECIIRHKDYLIEESVIKGEELKKKVISKTKEEENMKNMPIRILARVRNKIL